MKQPIKRAGDTIPSPWLRVLCYGSRPGTTAFAKTWPSSMIVAVDGDVFQRATNAMTRELLEIIEQVAQRSENAGKETLIVDLWTSPDAQLAEATGPIWGEQHRRYFDALFTRWNDRHVVILAGEQIIGPPRGSMERRAYAPPTLRDTVDVIVETSVPFDDGVVPLTWGRCTTHRRIPNAVGLITVWNADLVLGLRPLPDASR